MARGKLVFVLLLGLRAAAECPVGSTAYTEGRDEVCCSEAWCSNTTSCKSCGGEPCSCAEGTNSTARIVNFDGECYEYTCCTGLKERDDTGDSCAKPGYEGCWPGWCTSPDGMGGTDCWAGADLEECTCSTGEARETGGTYRHYYEYVCCTSGDNVGNNCGDVGAVKHWWGMTVQWSIIVAGVCGLGCIVASLFGLAYRQKWCCYANRQDEFIQEAYPGHHVPTMGSPTGSPAITHVGMQAYLPQLPRDWEAGHDANGTVYFYNRTTMQSQYEYPPEVEATEPPRYEEEPSSQSGHLPKLEGSSP